MTGYQTIVADPPWSYGGKFNGYSSGEITPKMPRCGTRKPLPYGTMTVPEIAALPVSDLAADAAHLYVWTTQRFLWEPCVLAGSSPQACAECGAPWERVTEQTLVPTAKAAKTFIVDERDRSADANDQGSNRQKDGHRPGWINNVRTLGWQPTCDHSDGSARCTVLDPFSGAGTTGVVALRHDRDYIGIELNSTYAEMARQRILDDAPLFNVEAA